MGERYLWVDRLCIIQDDKEHKDQQLKEMASIYSRSYFTIIAVDAPDANHGLHGLPGTESPRTYHLTKLDFSPTCSIVRAPGFENQFNMKNGTGAAGPSRNELCRTVASSSSEGEFSGSAGSLCGQKSLPTLLKVQSPQDRRTGIPTTVTLLFFSNTLIFISILSLSALTTIAPPPTKPTGSMHSLPSFTLSADHSKGVFSMECQSFSLIPQCYGSRFILKRSEMLPFRVGLGPARRIT